jgi:hypothetical protein
VTDDAWDAALSALDGADFLHDLDGPDAVSEEISALPEPMRSEWRSGTGEGDFSFSEDDIDGRQTDDVHARAASSVLDEESSDGFVDADGVRTAEHPPVPASTGGDQLTGRQVVLEIDVGGGTRAELTILPDSDPVVSFPYFLHVYCSIFLTICLLRHRN